MGRPREITDQEILAQARECFLEAGPTLSAAAIARKLGISEGTLFNRFSTKEQLMRRALGVPEPRWVELLVSDSPDLHAQLVRVARSLLSFFQEAMPAMNLLRAAGSHPASCDAQLAIRVECLRSTRFLVANLRSASRNPRVVGRPQGARRRLQLAESMPGMCAWCRQSCLVWLQTREPQSASRNPRAVGQSQAAARRLQLAASRPGMC